MKQPWKQELAEIVFRYFIVNMNKTYKLLVLFQEEEYKEKWIRKEWSDLQ